MIYVHPTTLLTARCLFGLPRPAAQVVSSGLHAHLLGRRIWTELYRESSYAGTVGANAAYDFNLQVFVPFQPVRGGGDADAFRDLISGGPEYGHTVCLSHSTHSSICRLLC